LNIVTTAFVLGAGLGTRLRPLTDALPKPLLPVAGRPLITHAFDHLLAAGISRLIVNTHHLPDAYARAFPSASYRGVPITFRHEPVLLDTGGGLRNIAGLVPPGEPLLVYNGDVLTDLPLAPLLDDFRQHRAPATLALRSGPEPRNVLLAPGGFLADLRGRLGRTGGTRCLFTGIQIVTPAFLQRIPPGLPLSVVETLLDLVREGTPPRGVLIDGGQWHDIGTPEAYQAIRDKGLHP
jgi:mannose-1-phosphate guanylyltransferase